MFIGDHHLTVLQKNSKNIFADIKLVPDKCPFVRNQKQ